MSLSLVLAQVQLQTETERRVCLEALLNAKTVCCQWLESPIQQVTRFLESFCSTILTSSQERVPVRNVLQHAHKVNARRVPDARPRIVSTFLPIHMLPVWRMMKGEASTSLASMSTTGLCRGAVWRNNRPNDREERHAWRISEV